MKWLGFIIYIVIMGLIDTYFIPTGWHYTFGFGVGTFGMLIPTKW